MSVPYQHDPIATAVARKHGHKLLRLSAKLASRVHVSVARAANMKVPYQHDPIATAVARKHGPKLLRTNKELASRAAQVFAASVYWDPVDKCYSVAAQPPKGETAPDLNELVADALAGRLSSEHAEPCQD